MKSAAVSDAPSSERPPVRMAHLGVGAFHRAHQAWYTEAANRAASADGGEQWGISAFTGRRPDAARYLTAQDCRYDLVVRGPEHDEVTRIDAIVEAHDGADAAAWRQAVSEVAIVTITVTEVGYHSSQAQLAADRAALAAGTLPASAVGRLVDGLRARRDAGGGALAVVSCDNLDGNGEVLRAQVHRLANDVDKELAAWIQAHVSFVSSMVDRITPALENALPIEITDDPCAVVTEPDSAWVLSGDFPAGRPPWEVAGAQFVDDIASFEKRKLWLLNAGHTLLANLGRMRGHEAVSEAMADPVCRDALEALWDDAAAVMPFTLDEIARERAVLVSRFENPRMRHALAQIALDSDVKLGVRVIPVIQERLRRGLDAGSGELAAIVAWANAVSIGLIEGPTLPADPDEAAESALVALAPNLAEDQDVRALLFTVAREQRGKPA